ncbi:MAG: glycosyltransferase family 2 protein [Verrucomicrobia bacterium]|jgi:polyisoprenyl-phosphate glycosyltransferase|nr:glycosyltransferase family 2 protein [Verrucomicrobiota bacterium]MBT7066707.1 glycosyltransferase family 2 protein [Verrucomicrobiota bacterium]MBT7700802.1 glycosyltransferase family 2 protein [Verrucomicrobiota bacterium]
MSDVERIETRLDTEATVSIVVPCYNEEEVIGTFHQRLVSEISRISDVSFDILFVDDGSSDETLSALEAIEATDGRAKVYSLSRNFGHQAALTAGLSVATGNAVICMDADLQHPPSLIGRMIESWKAGCDIVWAVRKDTEGVSFVKTGSSRLFYRLINAISDTPIIPGAADFYLLGQAPLQALRSMPERHRFLRGMISWIGFRQEFIDYTAQSRNAGTSKYTYRKMIDLALDAVFSFSPRPIRLISKAGVVVAALGGAYLLYVIAMLFLSPRVVPGWASMVGVVCVLGGFQLIATGIIGEYLARVFEEAKGRPLYIFKRKPEPEERHTS